MRLDKKKLGLQRRQLAAKLSGFASAAKSPRPAEGWIKAIRESLGMSAAQLGRRLGIAQPNIVALEKGEVKGTTSLNTLQKAAKALQCRLVYALVPDKPLEKILDDQALKAAENLVGEVSHSMTLEKQSISDAEKEAQIRETADELKNSLSRRLWDEP